MARSLLVVSMGVVALVCLSQTLEAQVMLGVNVVELDNGLGVDSVTQNSLASRMQIRPKSIILRIKGRYIDNNGNTHMIVRPAINNQRLTLDGLRGVLDRGGLTRVEITWRKNGVRHRNWANVSVPAGDVGQPTPVPEGSGED